MAVVALRGGAEALADNNGATTDPEEEWATTGPNALLADIIFCDGDDSGVMLFW